MTNSIRNLLKAHPIIEQFLRFVCIGLLNTALNFLVLNTVSKVLGISAGIPLGVIDFFSFTLAVIQSYLWNRTWTFGSEQEVSLLENFWRLVKVGALGALAIILVLVGSKMSAAWYFYAVILAVYLLLESGLWKSYRFHLSNWNHEGHSFIIFFIVTFIGLIINVALVSFVSLHLHLTHTVDLDKNIAVVIATGVSLFWNFTGYKLVVFKK
jgi:putative flippase GtrA